MQTKRMSNVTTIVHDDYKGFVHLVVNIEELKKYADLFDQTVRNADNGTMVALSVPFEDIKEFVYGYVKRNLDGKFDDFIDLLLE